MNGDIFGLGFISGDIHRLPINSKTLTGRESLTLSNDYRDHIGPNLEGDFHVHGTSIPLASFHQRAEGAVINLAIVTKNKDVLEARRHY